MKKIKLFEQMDEEDSWWTEPNPYDDKLLIFKYIADYKFYLGKLDDKSQINFLNNYPRKLKLDNWDIISKDEINNYHKFVIFDKDGIYPARDSDIIDGWKIFYYENLPEEIKTLIS